VDEHSERRVPDARKRGAWRRVLAVSSTALSIGVIMYFQMNRPDLTSAERAQLESVRRGNALWLQQAALGIGMKHPGEAFRPMAILPEPIAASIKKTGERTCEAFGFEDGTGQVVVLEIRKRTHLVPGFGSLGRRGTRRTGIASGMGDLLKKERQDAVVTTDDVVVRDGRELGRFDAVIAGVRYMFVRSLSLDRDNVEVLVDLLVLARDPTSLLPTVDSVGELP
jgi:hypothetical protein